MRDIIREMAKEQIHLFMAFDRSRGQLSFYIHKEETERERVSRV